MERKISLYNIYVFLFGLWIFFRASGSLAIFNNSYLSQISPAIKLLILLISFLFFVLRARTIKAWVGISLLLLIVSASYYMSKSQEIVFLTLVCLAVSDKDEKTLIKGALLGFVSGVVLVLVTFILGLTPDTIQIRLGKVRHSLGFSLPIILPSFYLTISAMYFYLNKNKFRYSQLILILAPLFLITYFCDGRAPFLCVMLLCIFVVLIKILNKRAINKKTLLLVLYGILLFMVGISLFFFSEYDSANQYHQLINEFSTGRMEWWGLYGERYPIKLFGQELARNGGASLDVLTGQVDMMILDNSYLSLLLEYGLIVFSLFILFLCLVIRKLVEAEEYVLVAIWFVFIIYGFSSNYLYFIDRNLVLLTLPMVFKNKEKREGMGLLYANI